MDSLCRKCNIKLQSLIEFENKMHSISGWKLARRPNYITNTDKLYPYSEVPFLGDYYLLKLPVAPDTTVEHVDYWGEGKIVTKQGNSGFADCYNVNHTYQLVSNGPDRGYKIPNRIPVYSYTNCDTSGYIKDNSVLTVTLMGAPINSSCAEDIARMVNKDLGKVVVFDFELNSPPIRNLITELQKKTFFYCQSYSLPSKLQGLTLFESHIAFLSLPLFKEEILNNVNKGSYINAVDLTKTLDNEAGREAIGDIVKKLVSNGSANIMAYTYLLWQNDGKEIVRKYFPPEFSLIFNQDPVTIVNKQFTLPLKFDTSSNSNEKLVMGDSSESDRNKLSWTITPVWDNKSITFKLYNMESDLYLKLDPNGDNIGDRLAWGSSNSDEESHRYYLEPQMQDGKLVFLIINCLYNQGLKLDLNEKKGDRQLWGHNGDPRTDSTDRMKWIIAAW